MRFILCNCLLIILVTLVTGCRFFDKPRALSLIGSDDKALGIVIPKSLVREFEGKDLHVRLVTAGDRSDILGDIKEEKDEFVFLAAVPLTHGLRYEIIAGDHSIGEVDVPESAEESPHLIQIYPTRDTVPENLLKIHLHFSKPMAEGKTMNYLTLIKDDRDTLRGTFLDLQPELWNEQGTELTVWLDPGRIKLDLMPNKALGNPLQKGSSYRLYISAEWKSKTGKALPEILAKNFYVSARDDRSPDPEKWNLVIPDAATYDNLAIVFNEALDQSLLQNTFSVYRDNSGVVGKFQITDQEKELQFFPEEAWKKGVYTLKIEARLEDLAGNNLNRLFEEDLLKGNKSTKERAVVERKFEIR